MKKTVLYQNVDGHKIITGFDRPTVDGVATTKAVNEAIKSTPEYAAAEAKKAEYAEAVMSMGELQKKFAKGAKVPRGDQEKWNTLMGILKIRQDELKPIAADLKAKLAALRVSEAVYFEPRTGEVAMDASEVDALISKIQGRGKGIVIALDGSEIEDNRGIEFYRKSGGKWGRTQIVKLGDKVPSDAKFESDITEGLWDEIEADRVAGLTDSVKAAERVKTMDKAMKVAAGMRNELEIKEDTAALKKSQAWYKKEVARIDGLYG